MDRGAGPDGGGTNEYGPRATADPSIIRGATKIPCRLRRDARLDVLAGSATPGDGSPSECKAVATEIYTGQRPESEEALAFMPVTELSALIRSRAVSSTELTKLYLGTFEAFQRTVEVRGHLHRGPGTQAGGASRPGDCGRNLSWAIARHSLGCQGLDRLPRIPTTWGAPQFKDRVIDEKATVAARLEEAGAVMLAKLTLGALARATSGSAAGPAARGTLGTARAASRPARRRRLRPVSSASHSAARHSAASSRPAGPVVRRPASDVRASQPPRLYVARLVDGQDSVRSLARLEDCASFSTPSTAPTASTRPP